MMRILQEVITFFVTNLLFIDFQCFSFLFTILRAFNCTTFRNIQTT